MADGYGETFAGLPTYSCSIPFLDLPPSSRCSDPQSIDYSEIFGGLGSNNGGDFAVDYEELYKPSKKTVGRIFMEAKFGQQVEEGSLLSSEAIKDLGGCSVKSNSSSISNHRDDSSKQFSTSDHRLNDGIIEDIVSGKTQVTQLHTAPGYTHMTDLCSSENLKFDSPTNSQTDDLIHIVSSDGHVNNVELGKKTSHTYSTDYMKISETDLNTSEKNFSTKLKHYSQSFSSHPMSTGDSAYPNVTYVSAYDINLRTRPSNVPPPSRAPPKLFSKQETTEMKMYRRSTGDQEENILKHTLNHQIHYRVGASKSGRFLGVGKDTSSSFFDADEDANSAAAAMKEAMEQAQAKLKSAKELMERERENLQSRKKLSQKEATKYNEMEIKASENGNIFHGEITKKPMLKEGKRMTKYALDDRKNVITEETEIYVVTTEESQQMTQGIGFKQMPYKSEKISGEWKTEEQFYELVNNEKKFRVVKEAFKHKDAEKKPKTTTDFDVDKHENNKIDERGHNISVSVNMTWKEDISETPNSVPETCILKENVNKLVEDHGFNYQKESEKFKAEQEALFSEQKLNKQNSSEKVSLCGISKNNGELLSDSFQFEEIYRNDEESGSCLIAEKACTHAVGVKKLSEMNLTSSYGIENKLNIKLQDNHQSRNDKLECKLEGTASASEQKESRNFDGTCMQVNIDLQSKLAQDGNEVKENSKIGKEMKPTKETRPDYNGIIEARFELLQNKKDVNANQMPSAQENTLKVRDMGANHADIQSKEVHEALRTSENFISNVHKTEIVESEWTIERETEPEQGMTRKSEEEKEREREREKDRGVIERAACEAREHTVSEAREMVERVAIEKALKEARLKAERAAVERALAEARERAVKDALDEIAAADAQKHAEKLNATYRKKGKKENASRYILRGIDGEDTKLKLKAGSSDAVHAPGSVNVGSSSISQRYANSYAYGEVESPLRCKARLERHQRTIDRAAKALAEKNMRDDLAQREQTERNRLAESLDADIRRWSTGKDGNLRALLSTLQYILGPESGWQPIPLTDVITAAAAKKAYRKATLCVHPDKLQQRGANIQQKYICEKVFDLLKDAWNQFNSEER